MVNIKLNFLDKPIHQDNNAVPNVNTKEYQSQQTV